MNFPEPTENKLGDLHMDIHQLKHAKSYTDEHFDENGQYEIIMHKETEDILKPRFISGVQLEGTTVADEVGHKQLVAVHIQHLYSRTSTILNS